MKTHRILVVDDDADICKLLKLYLEHKGFAAKAVHTDPDARALLEQERFELVIVDWHLGGTDGLDLLRFIKARDASMPTIVYTGTDVPLPTLKQALAGWADAVVAKMGPLDTLMAQVSRLLGTGRPALGQVPDARTSKVRAPGSTIS